MHNSIVGHEVAVVALARQRAPYVPLGEATLFSLFPDQVFRGERHLVEPRLVEIRMSRNEILGKLIGRDVRWWDLDALRSRYKIEPRKHGRAHYAMIELERALSQRFISPFGEDLPIYVDSTASNVHSLDWTALEIDVVRGLNGKIPFVHKLSRRVRGKIYRELPFLDVSEHFRSVVPDDTVMSLIRQLLDQHTKTVQGRSLIPARWVGRIGKNDTVLVETGVPAVISFACLSELRVQVGALNVPLGRTRRPYAKPTAPLVA